jgi:hypothetical protein
VRFYQAVENSGLIGQVIVTDRIAQHRKVGHVDTRAKVKMIHNTKIAAGNPP